MYILTCKVQMQIRTCLFYVYMYMYVCMHTLCMYIGMLMFMYMNSSIILLLQINRTSNVIYKSVKIFNDLYSKLEINIGKLEQLIQH